MVRTVLGRLVSATGWLIVEDPGGDEPRARQFATRRYLGMHVLRMEPGAWFVSTEGQGAGVVLTISREPSQPAPELTQVDELVVGSTRVVVAEAAAFTQEVYTAIIAGKLEVARREGVVVDGWVRPRSRVRWDRSPDTRFVRIEPL